MPVINERDPRRFIYKHLEFQVVSGSWYKKGGAMVPRQKTLSEREAEVKEEYHKTLQDLTYSSKPLIDVLTEVADENKEYASCIVRCIEEQLERVSSPLKLPILYLIDSIIKYESIKQYYLPKFCRNIHKLFAKVYEMGDDTVRNKLAKLRFTWNDVFPVETLLQLDNTVRSLNPTWQTASPPAVHVNPKFIPVGVAATKLTTNAANVKNMPTTEELRQKQKELKELTQRKQELEQELKVLKPMKSKPGECKKTDKLMIIANELLSQVEQLKSQVEQVKSGKYIPSEVQRVREWAGEIKKLVQSLIGCPATDPRFAVIAKDSATLNDLLQTLTETEKVLVELEKSNQPKRKVIYNIMQESPERIVVIEDVTSKKSESAKTENSIRYSPTTESSWSKSKSSSPKRRKVEKVVENAKPQNSDVNQKAPSPAVVPVVILDEVKSKKPEPAKTKNSSRNSPNIESALPAQKSSSSKKRKIEKVLDNVKPQNSDPKPKSNSPVPVPPIIVEEVKPKKSEPSKTKNSSRRSSPVESTSPPKVKSSSPKKRKIEKLLDSAKPQKSDTNQVAPSSVVMVPPVPMPVMPNQASFGMLFSTIPEVPSTTNEDMLEIMVPPVPMPVMPNQATFGMLFNTIPEVPSANKDVLEMIDRDPMTTINIDAIPREIRHYGSTAVVFINWDNPRQILFSSHDAPRRIVVDGNYVIRCSLNAADVESVIHGKPHRFRLGAPTRELYIDGIGYECYFGGAPIKVHFDGRYHSVRLEGSPPKVDIGQKRLDLVAGKIDLIVNDKHTFPVFLDAKPQKFEVDGKHFVVMFIDSLQRVLLNDVPFSTDFGGLPQTFKYYNKVYNFRFSMLPVGIVPGAVSIHQMITSKLPAPPPLPPSLLPVPSMIPNSESSPMPVDTNVTVAAPEEEKEAAPESLSIDELMQKLLAEGLVSLPSPTSTTTTVTTTTTTTTSSSSSTSKKNDRTAVENKTVKFVDFGKPETLKQRQPAMIAMLYTGNQCGSCGLRFPEEQTLKYSEHLDWHFRQNRRGKDGARTIHSRKWYYNSSDWMQFQEMEDKSDRGQSWFDNHPATEITEEEVEEVPCVTASPNSQDNCELCCDRFEQFFNEDKEEWQLRNAIKVDDKLYHPICFKGHKDQPDDDDVEIEETGLPEPIDVDDPAITKDDNDHQFDVVIKQEKDGKDTVAKAKLEDTSERSSVDEDEDSDIEEVQLIEEPIEEIIIPDDANDLEESNLETLNAEEIILAQQEIENSVVDIPVEAMPVNNVVDITQPVATVSIDGNIELGDSLKPIVSGPMKIKINIAKNHTTENSNHIEEKTKSPKNGDIEKTDSVGNFSDLDEQPPPPGEERMATLVPADLKPRLRDRKLTEYPPVKKGVGDSGLCTIM